MGWSLVLVLTQHTVRYCQSSCMCACIDLPSFLCRNWVLELFLPEKVLISWDFPFPDAILYYSNLQAAMIIGHLFKVTNMAWSRRKWQLFDNCQKKLFFHGRGHFSVLNVKRHLIGQSEICNQSEHAFLLDSVLQQQVLAKKTTPFRVRSSACKHLFRGRLDPASALDHFTNIHLG